MRAGAFIRAALLATFAATAAGPASADDSEAEKVAAEENAEEEALPAELAKAFEESRAKIEALGIWAVGFDLDLTKSRVAETLLLFDRDHEKAREWLGSKRQKNGAWKPGPCRTLVDQRPEKLPEWTKRRDDTLGAFRDRLAALLEKCVTWRSAGPRDRAVRALAALWPEEPRWREAHGEIQVAGEWVLVESAATAKNRQAIVAAVAKSKAEAAAVPHAVTGERTVSAGGLVVGGTLEPAAATVVLDAVLAAEAAFPRIVGLPAKLPSDKRLVLLRDSTENADYVARLEDVDAARRERLAEMGAYWHEHECVVALPEEAERVDAAVRMFLDKLEGPFVKLVRAPACLSEGIGTYLTFRLVGTRLTAFNLAEKNYADDGVRRETAKVDSDWTLVARKLVDKGYALDLPVLLGLPLNSMSKDDGLVAYAFAAYLLEGRPADAAALLKALADKERGLSRAVAETLHVDEVGLQDRFVRWLRELPAK
jgi:hypothetical protein